MCKDPHCEYCEECPYCGHQADEHMAGDFEGGICFICQRQGKECSDLRNKKLEQFAMELK